MIPLDGDEGGWQNDAAFWVVTWTPAFAHKNGAVAGLLPSFLPWLSFFAENSPDFWPDINTILL